MGSVYQASGKGIGVNGKGSMDERDTFRFSFVSFMSLFSNLYSTFEVYGYHLLLNLVFTRDPKSCIS